MSAPLARSEPRIVDGKYAVLRKLGEGSRGSVYEAESLALGKRVALKLLPAELADNAEQRTSFLGEARTCAQLSHAHVVSVVDLGVAESGVPYLVMELLEGRTLLEVLQQSGPFAASEAVELVLQVLSGLSAAHQRGLAHGGLQPSKVILTYPRPQQPLVKLLDLGLAQALAHSGVPRSAANGAFVAPEQRRGELASEASDVYAVAALLLVLLTGSPELIGKALSDAGDTRAAAERVSARALAPKLPKALGDLIDQGMRFERERRPTNAEFTLALTRWLESGAPTAHGSVRSQLRHTSLPNEKQTARIDVSSPPQSTVVRVDVAPRLLTDSLLVAPRLPKAPAPPNLEPGRDFLPMLGDPERKDSSSGPTEFVHRAETERMNLRPALLAMVIGFGAGILIAWAAGLI